MNKKSKVILLPCSSYREEIVYENLEIGLELLGGIEKIVKKEESILLKPNLLKKAEVDKAVITHPSVVGMFARLMREKGYQDLSLADSCGNGTTTRVIHGTGIDRYLEKYGITAIDYSKGIRVEYPEGIQTKEFILPKELLEKDCVISLCKMKTHALERITGAVKNSYGFIYGFHKFCENACRSESVCKAKALYYGWHCCDGRERTRFRRSGTNECDVDVAGPCGTGQCVL